VPTEFTCDGTNETPAVTIEGMYGIKLFGLSSALGLDRPRRVAHCQLRARV
jgi:hypothetical protein